MSIVDRLANQLASKAAVAGLERLDLSIQDYAVAKDNNSARILISYDKKLKVPTPTAIENYVFAKFDRRLEPQMSTALWHADMSAVSVIATTQRLTRELTDTRGLVPAIANTLYLDQKINANWKVASNPATGKKYLECVRDEDIGKMLSAAKVHHSTASFLGANTAVGFILPEKGDYVEFFADNGLRQGEVTKVKDNEANIVEEGGETYIVEIPNITKMLRKNPKSRTAEQEQLVQALIPAMVTREMAEKVVFGPGSRR